MARILRIVLFVVVLLPFGAFPEAECGERDYYVRMTVRNSEGAALSLNGFPVFEMPDDETGGTSSKWATSYLLNGKNVIVAKIGRPARKMSTFMKLAVRSAKHGEKRIPENDKFHFEKDFIKIRSIA